MTNNRRRRKLVRLDLQLKIVFITLFVASLVLLINFQLTLAGLWSLSNQFLENKSVDMLLEGLRSSTIQKFLVSVCLAVPLAGSVGILYSFKFCGPIYRFKKYFTDVRTGRWDERCMLRKGDDLQDVCDAINGGVDVLRARIRESHELLQQVQTFLDEAVFTADGSAATRLEDIRRGIRTEGAVFQERFGGVEPSVSAPPSQSAGATEEAVEDAESELATAANQESREGS